LTVGRTSINQSIDMETVVQNRTPGTSDPL
jgi:hypothetical protein